jgi:hypothetical protein
MDRPYWMTDDLFQRLTNVDRYGGFPGDVGEVRAERRRNKIGVSTVDYTVYFLKVRNKTKGGPAVWLELPHKKPDEWPATLAGIKTARKLEQAQNNALENNKLWKDQAVRVQADAEAAWLATQQGNMAALLEDADQRRAEEEAAAEEAEARAEANRRANT